jgi:hypothetical protein
MPARDRSDRVIIARLAAHEKWAFTADRTGATAKARQVAWARFDKVVDPEGVLPPDERARRADSARRAYFLRLSLKSAQARRSRGSGS